MTTRLVSWCLLVTLGGCATAPRPGDALVVGGAVTATAASFAATRRQPNVINCYPNGSCEYSASTSNSRAQRAAAVGIAAGIGLAALGAAINERERASDARALGPSRPASPGATIPLESEEEAMEEASEQRSDEEAARTPKVPR